MGNAQTKKTMSNSQIKQNIENFFNYEEDGISSMSFNSTIDSLNMDDTPEYKPFATVKNKVPSLESIVGGGCGDEHDKVQSGGSNILQTRYNYREYDLKNLVKEQKKKAQNKQKGGNDEMSKIKAFLKDEISEQSDFRGGSIYNDKINIDGNGFSNINDTSSVSMSQAYPYNANRFN